MPPFHPYRPSRILLAFVIFAALSLLFLSDVAEENFPGTLSTQPLVDPAGVLQVWAWQEFSTAELLRGHFPLWNPHTALGQPHLANLQTAVFFPLWLQEVWRHNFLGHDRALILRLILAATLVFVLMQNLGAKFSGSLAAGLIYAYGGYGLWFIQLVELNSQLILPLLMLVFNKLFKARTWSNFLAATLLLSLIILGGHPEAVFNTISIGYLYLLFLASSRRRFTALAPAALAGPVGLLLAGLVLLPFANYLPRCWSLHQPGFGFFHLEARGILNLFWPGIHRIFADQPAAIPIELLERGTRGLLGSGYRETAVPGVPPGLGLVPMLLVLGALTRLHRLPRVAAFFAALLAVLLGLTFGLPGFRLLALLPVFNLASNFKFYFSEIHLSFAVLAGFGLEQLVSCLDFRGAGDHTRASTRRTLLAAVLLAALLVNLFYHSRQVKPYINLGTEHLYQPYYSEYIYQPEFYLIYLQRERANSGPFRITGLEGFFPANLATAFGLDDLRSSDALFYRPYLDLLNRLNGLNEKQALRYFYPSYYTQPSPERLDQPLASLMGIRFAVGRRKLQPGEIMDQVLYHSSGLYGVTPPQKLRLYFDTPQPSLFQHPPSRLDYHLSLGETGVRLGFTPGRLVWYPNSDGVNFYLWRDSPIGPKLLFTRFVSQLALSTARFEIFLTPENDQEGTLHLATDPGPKNNRDSDWAGWTELTATPVHEATTFPLVTLLDQDHYPVYLAQNSNAFPRAFSVSRSLPAPAAEELPLLAALSLAQLRELATVPVGLSPAVQGYPADHGKVELLSYEPDRVELEVRRASEGLLVLADAYYPGWRAWVDEKEAKIIPADHALRGLALAPGKHRVVFIFQPLDFRLGLWVSLVTLATAGAWLLLITGRNACATQKRRAGHA